MHKYPVADCYMFYREVCIIDVVHKRSSKLGGQGENVELDELKFRKMECGRDSRPVDTGGL